MTITLLYRDGSLTDLNGELVCVENPGPCCGPVVARLCGQPCAAAFTPTESSGPEGQQHFRSGGRCWYIEALSLFDPPVNTITPGEWFFSCFECVEDLRDDCLPTAIVGGSEQSDPCDFGGPDDLDCSYCDPDGIPDGFPASRVVGTRVERYTSRQSSFCGSTPPGCQSDVSINRQRSLLIERYTADGFVIRNGRRVIRSRSPINCQGLQNPWEIRVDEDLSSISTNPETRCIFSTQYPPQLGFALFTAQWQTDDFQGYCANNSSTENFDPPGPERGRRESITADGWVSRTCRTIRQQSQKTYNERVYVIDNLPFGFEPCYDAFRQITAHFQAFVSLSKNCPLGGLPDGDADDWDDATQEECDAAFVAIICRGGGPDTIAYSLRDFDSIPQDANPNEMLLEYNGDLYKPTLYRTLDDPVPVRPVFDETCDIPQIAMRACDPLQTTGAPFYVEMPSPILDQFGVAQPGDIYVAKHLSWDGDSPTEHLLCYEVIGETDPEEDSSPGGFADWVEIIGVSDFCDPCLVRPQPGDGVDPDVGIGPSNFDDAGGPSLVDQVQ